jgi:hypothetical protein
MIIEFHYWMNCWFIGFIENDKFFDFSQAEENHPNEIGPDEMSGDWPIESNGSGVADYLFRGLQAYWAGEIDDTPIVTIRGHQYRVCSFSAFHCGYDMIRFGLDVVAEQVKGGAQ